MKGIRRRGTPRKRWFESVGDDIRKLQVRNWKELVRVKKRWRDLVEQAQDQNGVYIANMYYKKVLCGSH